MAKNNSLTDNKVYVIYKRNPPARVVDVQKIGRKIYLKIRWENRGKNHLLTEKWVRESLCTEYKPTEKEKESLENAISVPLTEDTLTLNWWQKLIIKLKNWWYVNSN